MKKLIFALSLFLAFFAIIFISSATACHFENVEITADCEGFCISGDACIWGTYHDGAALSYELQVTDAYGQYMYNFGTTILQEEGVDTCLPFEYCGDWEQEFCGDVSVEGFVYMESLNTPLDDKDLVELTLNDFFCPCACTRTPGYYKKSDNWPDGVTELTIGGEVYSKDYLLDYLKKPVRGDLSVKLMQHLIAAMLNVINEPSNDTPLIQSYISMANSYFADPAGCDKYCVEEMKDALDEFNNSGEYWCDMDEDDED